MMYAWFAATAAGIEGIAGRELRELGLNPRVETGRCFFEGTPHDALRAMTWLRTADRVFLLMGRFPVRSFDELFEATRALPWEDFVPRDAAIPVRGSCVRSQLMSLPDCQRIVKKAIAVRMTGSREGILPESGAVHAVEFHIHGDEVLLGIDACGGPLHKRGYRAGQPEILHTAPQHTAPVRETLAAAMLLSSPWRRGEPLCDPMCGSGTILIEAALIAADMPPNPARSFSLLSWRLSSDPKQKLILSEAGERRRSLPPGRIFGGDLDADAVAGALAHARAAGLGEDALRIGVLDAKDTLLPPGGGWMAVNPPYGVRLGGEEEARAAARTLGALYAASDWGLVALTPDAGFERGIGARAAKHRRFYNGRIECRALVFSPKRRS